jgi:hypothetical protein
MNFQRVINRLSNTPVFSKAAFKIGERIDLHKPNGIKTYLDIVTYDKLGRSSKPYHQKSESFTTGFFAIMLAQIGTPTYVINDTSGTPRTLGNGGADFICEGGSGSTTNGIQAGTGTTTPAASDTALTTLIANGVGSGQLQYQNTVINAPTVSGNTTSMVIQRTVTNSSGASITIKEVGLVQDGIDTGGGTRRFLTMHDLIDGGTGYAVANTASADIKYTWQTTT